MATLDEIRLQQLLSPFQNQNIGITNTTNAAPFINTADILNQYNVPGLRNQDLVQQIIAENQMKANVFSRPNMMNIAGTYLPGGITNIPTSINQQPFNDYYGPTNIDTSFGVANEEDVEEDVEGARRKGGLADLFRAILGFAVPGAGLFMGAGRGALEGIQSLNQKFRNTMFGQSKTGAEFFQKLRDKRAREEAAERGAIKQQELARQTALQQMRSDDAYGGGGGGIGSSYGGSASPGSQGPGGSDEMGSF